jgi:hypothetical protein
VNADELRAIMLDAGSENLTIHVSEIDPKNWLINVDRMFVAEWPSWLQGLVGPGLSIKEKRTWTLLNPSEGSGTMSLDVVGQPVKMRGDVSLESVSAGTAIVIRASVTASIPFLGGKIEAEVCKYLKEGIEHEIRAFDSLS